MLRFLTLLRSARGLVLFFLLVCLVLIAISFASSVPVRAVKTLALAGVSFPLKTLSWSFGLGSRNAEYRELQKKCLRLALENAQMREMVKENTRLRRLLAFKEKANFSYFPAEVLGRNPDIINNTIIVQGGKDLGVKIDQPAVMADGVVGKVVDVTWNTTVVQLLIDQNARVSAVDQRSRELGIIEWYQGNLGRLKNIEKSDDVAVGDTIVTSGMGGIYPKGLMVGTVIKVDNAGPDLFKEVVVDFSVDFSFLEEIFILRLD
jgi:rod shape-determining protein MreC